MHNDIEKVSVTSEEIENIINELASKINNDYKGKFPLFIGLLKGCLPFMSDLVKKINLDCMVDYIKVSSYSGASSTGNLIIKGELTDVKGLDVIIVDDILDTGRTLKEMKSLLLEKGANSVSLCVLLDKPEGRVVDIKADYVGGDVPNEFVVGYGLDYNEKYRNLPYIGVLKKEVYSK